MDEQRRLPTLVPVDQAPQPNLPRMVPVDAGRQVNTAGMPPVITRENLQQLQIAPDITSFGERMGRGVMDVGQGLKQLYMMAVRPPEEAKAYTQEVNKEIAAYQERLGSKPGHGYCSWSWFYGLTGPGKADPWRTGGAVGTA